MARENIAILGSIVFVLLCYLFSKAFRASLEADRWPDDETLNSTWRV